MKNRLCDLNDHLFMQLERLQNEELTSEQIGDECKRAAAIVDVADKIVDNAKLHLDACKLMAAHGDRFKAHLPMLAAPPREAKP